MDWDECKSRKFVKKVKEDKFLVQSLLKSSHKKLISNKRLFLDETTSSTKVSILYESLREILEALAIKKGFKIYNHECFCSFLKEICNEPNFSRDFDKFRKIRNRINYYGEEVSVNEAKIFIIEIIKLRRMILENFFKK